MFTLHSRLKLAQHHLWRIVLAVSTLAIGFSDLALAKPQSPSKVKAPTVPHHAERVATSADPFAVPVDKVVANAKRKLSNAALPLLITGATKAKASDRVKPAVRNPTTKNPAAGTAKFTDPDRTKLRSNDFSAVNDLIE